MRYLPTWPSPLSGDRYRRPHTENGQIVENATGARAGRPGWPVLYVLLYSTAAVIVLFAIVYFFV